MKIVLDTNIVIASRKRLLRGPEFETLQNVIGEGEATLAVPRVVVEEAVRRYREDLSEQLTKMRSCAKKASSLSLTAPIEIPDVDLAAQTAAYEIALTDRIEELGGEILGYDEVPVASLVKRDLDRRRPFRTAPDGGPSFGFRDAVIWETIIRKIAEVEQTTIWVTNNRKDFGDGKGKFHSDLVADAISLGLPAATGVVLCDSMETLSEIYLKPRLERLEGLFGLTTEGVLAYFQHELDRFIADFDRHLRHMNEYLDGAYPGASEASIASLSTPHKLNWVDSYRLDDKDVLVSATGEVEALIDFFMAHGDLHSLPDKIRVSVADPDWNDWVSRVQADVSLTFGVQIVFNPDLERIVNAEVTHLEFFPQSDIEEPADHAP